MIDKARVGVRAGEDAGRIGVAIDRLRRRAIAHAAGPELPSAAGAPAEDGTCCRDGEIVVGAGCDGCDAGKRRQADVQDRHRRVLL